RCSRARFCTGCDYYLVDVGIDHEVRVVRNDDDLTTFARFPEEGEQFRKDRLRIKVFFRLIDDQRPGILEIESKVQQEQHDPPCARRKLRDRDALIFYAVVNSNMVRGIQPPAKAYDPLLVLVTVTIDCRLFKK